MIVKVYPMSKDNENQQNRQEIRKQKVENKKKKRRKPIRLIPIWLRLFIVILIFAASLALGLMFGYGIVGDGTPRDAITKGPWQKIYDIVYKLEE